MKDIQDRVIGSENTTLIECINDRYNIYRVRWDMKPYYDDKSNEQYGVSFLETEFLHKPTMQEIQSVILGWFNKRTDELILSGFTWNGMQVWLSSENQFNYKAAYDLAVQTNGANLPTVFKFGDNTNPVYHKFDTVEELSDFYMKAMSYINNCLAIGWAKKDAIDWEQYKLQE